MQRTPALRTQRAATAVTGVLALSFVASQNSAPDPAFVPDSHEVVYYDFLDEAGQLDGGARVLPRHPDPMEEAVAAAPVTTLHAGAQLMGAERGSGDNRLDIVFVGDGYTQSEMAAYQANVDTVVQGLFSTEPLGRYADVIAIHRVDVVSNESGVDNDPVQGISRDTALDMEYWCGGTERLLCVNVGAAYSFAQNAPDVDQVVALANSSKYGGAGYISSNLSTSAGANGAAIEIVKHELGHSLGNLADEYTYGGPSNWTGGEPSRENVSTLDAATMAAQSAKWHDWLGASASGFEGTIGTVEGANYSEFGIYRPTNNSLMRNLGRPFNLVGAEEVIKEIYQEISVIDSASDPMAAYTSSDVLTVVPILVDGQQLPVQWEVNGVPLVGQTSGVLDLSTLGMGLCAATVTATVVDDTPWLRDEAYRAAFMTEVLQYDINAVWQSRVCDSEPNSVGTGAEAYLNGQPSLTAQDLTFGAFGGPPNVPMLVFYGDALINAPLGEGTLCAGGTQQRVAVTFFDPLGQALYPIDWSSPQLNQPGTTITAGSTWIFQGWYRDLTPAGAQTFNLTSAVSVSFCQ